MFNIFHFIMENYKIIAAVAIFVIAYILIISEVLHRTAVALIGAALMIVLQVFPDIIQGNTKISGQTTAFGYIDWNTIGLLVGMMIVVNILKRTGAFQYTAIKAAKLAKGDPWKIILFFSIITGVASAFLNNVTTILLIAPVTFVITDTLKVNPIPFIIPEIFASNIIGTATLIGDPPNIMVGTSAQINFGSYFVHMAPVIVVVFIVTMLLFQIVYKKQIRVSQENRAKILSFDETKAITDKPLLIKCLVVLLIIIVGFIISGPLEKAGIDLQAATLALFGAALLIILSKIDIEEILLEVEWPAIFFFIGLFVIVGGLQQSGVISDLGQGLVHLTGNNLFITAMLILWVSAFASSILDNIPYVATMIPLIWSLNSSMNIAPLWWALLLGACLGGNGTLIGASPNVVGVALLNKNGTKFGFADFFKVGFPLMIVQIAISAVYLYFVYLNSTVANFLHHL